MRVIETENTLISSDVLIKQKSKIKWKIPQHVTTHDSKTLERCLFVPQWEINTIGKTDAGYSLPDEDSMCQSSRSGCVLASHGVTSGLSICFSRQQQHWLRKSITNSVGSRAAVQSHSAYGNAVRVVGRDTRGGWETETPVFSTEKCFSRIPHFNWRHKTSIGSHKGGIEKAQGPFVAAHLTEFM